MPFEIQDAEDGVSLILTGRLGVQQARPLWDVVQPAIGAGRNIHIHAAALDDIDTSIVQILCRVGHQTGRLRIGETSDGFMASLKSRGLEKYFVQSTAPAREARMKPKRPAGRAPRIVASKVQTHG